MRMRAFGSGLAQALAVALLVAAVAACSPENDRRPRGGPGADVGNRSYPLPDLHGARAKNNPSAKVPEVGRAPREAKGVPGFWAEPGPRK